MLVRLQKYMAECGVGARRKCESLIAEGRVFVDGVPVTDMGVKIDPSVSTVTLDETPLSVPDKQYIALNKPVGYITGANGQFGRKTVLDLVEADTRLFPVGRLDYNTSGMLFLTNDGDFAYKLTHPKHRIEKTYLAELDGTPTETDLNALRNGVVLEDGPCAPCKVVFADKSRRSLLITITEGRNRQVRRMCAVVGHDVICLKRLSIGGVSLGELKPGEYRRLTPGEVDGFLPHDS